MQIIPAVRAAVKERYILNFRMPPEAMRQFLPVEWLHPAEVEGHAVASFCMLDLRNITIAPFPAVAGLSSLSCAPRYAVIDRSKGKETKAAFVTERYTTPRSARGLRRWVLPRHIRTLMPRSLSVGDAEGELFAARVTTGDTEGGIFSVESFAAFIAQRISSYG